MKARMTADSKNINQIIMLSAWSFTIVVSSLLFLYIGRQIDVTLNTEPGFMIGLLILGISLCILRLYKDFTHMNQHLARRRQRRV